MTTQLVYLRYLGRKDWGLDSFAGTGTIWHGHGDIQPVPAEAAKILLRYPTVWEEVTANQALQAQQESAVEALKKLTAIEEGKAKLEKVKAEAKAKKAAGGKSKKGTAEATAEAAPVVPEVPPSDDDFKD